MILLCNCARINNGCFDEGNERNYNDKGNKEQMKRRKVLVGNEPECFMKEQNDTSEIDGQVNDLNLEPWKLERWDQAFCTAE